MSDQDRWRRAVQDAIQLVGTPCFVVAAPIIAANLRRLESLFEGLPVRHLLSTKTLPMRPLLEMWNRRSLGIDVVSECELVAALDVGFPPHRILVNGVAKHEWLPRYPLPGLRVHFDSVHEAKSLSGQARAYNWSVGLRLNLPRSIEFDPDEPRFGTQFGLTVTEAAEVSRHLDTAGVRVDGVQVHIGTDVRDVEGYQQAIIWARNHTAELGLTLRYLDVGGGVPTADTCDSKIFDLDMYRSAVRSAYDIPDVTEVWLENGRFLSGTAGVLAVRVCDVKRRDGTIYVICDGGRTNHALVSEWEEPHPVEILPMRGGETLLTTVCGPTCMAFDRLGRFNLPAVNVGDVIVWKNAGSYHLPWETRFSHGRCAVVWCDEHWCATVARHRESPQEWWSEWCAPAAGA